MSDDRKKQFGDHVENLAKRSTFRERKPDCSRYECPCCSYHTLLERGGYEICPVCFWEDDGQDVADANTVRGGSNGSLSLSQARANFKVFGACAERHCKHVRKANESEGG